MFMRSDPLLCYLGPIFHRILHVAPIKQIKGLLVIYFHKRHKAIEFYISSSDFLKNNLDKLYENMMPISYLQGSRDNSTHFPAFLKPKKIYIITAFEHRINTRAGHCVSFSASRLTIGKDCPIITFQAAEV